MIVGDVRRLAKRLNPNRGGKKWAEVEQYPRQSKGWRGF